MGAALELPPAGLLLGPLASAVAFSRIYTGVHYPSDVIAGALLGSSVALATRTFWATTPQRPAQARLTGASEVERRSNGHGVTIVVNAAAGSSWSRDLTGELERSLPAARIVEVGVEEDDDLQPSLETAAEEADVVGISGGDGSINCAARVALERRKPLLVIPGGTLNHLARDIGVEDVSTAVRALEEGRALAMDVATIDGRPFLNTASFGAYPELVDARERLESSIGKWPAMVFALARVLRHGTPVDVEIDGEQRKIWMIFIGNCRYHPSGFAPAWRERLDDGRLDVRLIDASAPVARVRLVVSILTGRLGRSRIYEQRLATNLKVRSLDGPLRIACDGETFDGSEEFVVEKLSDPLPVYAPVG
jgi:undecaprenyl-diphosphatase